MVAMDKIQSFVDRLVEAYEPERVLLFGSYAWGNPTDDSDVDIMVVMPCDVQSAYKAAEMRSRLRPGFPLDLIVRTPETIAQRLAWNDYFLLDIFEKGIILYESAHPRVNELVMQRTGSAYTRRVG